METPTFAAQGIEPRLSGSTLRTPPDRGSGLVFEVAQDMRSVLKAWELVYTAYRRIGLIDFNHQHIHTVPPGSWPPQRRHPGADQ